MLQNGTLPAPGITKAVDAIVRNGDALTKLVNDVLDVSRIVTGKMRLNLQAFDLADIVLGGCRDHYAGDTTIAEPADRVSATG